MKEWKLRQKIFYKIFEGQDLGDNFSEMETTEDWESKVIVEQALEYPVKQLNIFSYPAKSYTVAITFAKLLEQKFGENFYDALADESLLYDNDPYFKSYDKDKETYDRIIERFPWELLENPNLASDNYQRTVDYFYREFLLHEETKLYAPS